MYTVILLFSLHSLSWSMLALLLYLNWVRENFAISFKIKDLVVKILQFRQHFPVYNREEHSLK